MKFILYLCSNVISPCTHKRAASFKSIIFMLVGGQHVTLKKKTVLRQLLASSL
jgi:hypothetical protein